MLFGWAAHLSPFTEQPPSYILSAITQGLAGWVALGVLLALMLVMSVAGVYAAYLWRRESSGAIGISQREQKAVRRRLPNSRCVSDADASALRAFLQRATIGTFAILKAGCVVNRPSQDASVE